MFEENYSPKPESDQPKIIWLSVVVVLLLVGLGVVLALKKNTQEKVVTTLSEQPQPPTGTRSPVTSQTTEPAGPVTSGHISLLASERATVGETVTVQARLDTQGHNINLAKLYLEYDQERLEYQSFSAEGSMLPLALRLDKADGTVIVSRGAPGDADYQDTDDGFTGNGLFGTFVFQALRPGTAELRLRPAETKLYLDDGQATELELELEDMSMIIE